MEQIKYYFELYKKQIILGISILITFLLASISFFIINKKYNNEEILLEEENNITAILEEKNIKSDEITKHKIKIDIKGCVKNPGVYELDDDKRVIDAINLAGGLSNNAHTESLNLSQKLNDEDIIIIYSKDEYNKNKNNEQNNSSIKNNSSSVITKKTETKTTSSTNSKTATNNNNSSLNTIVNINTASKETLMTLNGIGESKANKIIEYRNENNGFKNIEELKNVKGIGDAIYAKIKENITI